MRDNVRLTREGYHPCSINYGKANGVVIGSGSQGQRQRGFRLGLEIGTGFRISEGIQQQILTNFIKYKLLILR